ncbi:MAG: glutamate-1-semialdehyde 2,1-aminomutase [Myxococcales bacterium]|jgi:glutamate-1-semialdehyde 2,1-aminomutase|nr:glutamate-1-semialdehyde 2,1-aminomutase [Myxococcales bacterium]
MTQDRVSEELFERAKRLIPGGVNSPVRAFKAVGGSPVFIREAKGAKLVGEDGQEYVDYVGSWGPMILGHGHPEVQKAVAEQLEKGVSYGAPTRAEVEFADVLVKAVPSMDMVRLVSSGTEATMGALRLARGFTGRTLIAKCEGAYHGGADYLLVKGGSGLATLGEPDSAGVPAQIAATTTVIPYNDVKGAERLFLDHGHELAAVIVEPVAGNMGCVPPDPAWLSALSRLTRATGALLIFDEVMTGFRVAFGGAQERYGIKPDLTCFGKIVGGGLPLAAYGGRRDVMEQVAPAGPVYQAGTLSGNPLAVAAGRKTLEILSAPGTYDRLEAISAQVEAIAQRAIAEAGKKAVVQRVGAMLTIFFTEGPVRNWADAARADKAAFARFHAALLSEGVYWPPSQFEAAFISLAHDDEALEKTEKAMIRAMAAA